MPGRVCTGCPAACHSPAKLLTPLTWLPPNECVWCAPVLLPVMRPALLLFQESALLPATDSALLPVQESALLPVTGSALLPVQESDLLLVGNPALLPFQESALQPPAITYDAYNCHSNNMRMTTNAIPNSTALRARCELSLFLGLLDICLDFVSLVWIRLAHETRMQW